MQTRGYAHLVCAFALLAVAAACKTTGPWRAYDGPERPPHEEALLIAEPAVVADTGRLPAPKMNQFVMRVAEHAVFQALIVEVDGKTRDPGCAEVHLLPGPHTIKVKVTVTVENKGQGTGVDSQAMSFLAKVGSRHTLRVRPTGFGLVGVAGQGECIYAYSCNLSID